MTDRTELFDRWAEQYDRSLLNTEGFPFEGYRAVLRRLFELAEPRAGLRVLDVGTGTGALAALFANAGCAVTGIDFSEEMLKRARERVPEGEFVQVDLLGEWAEVMRQQSFDLVVSSYVLHEFPDDKKVELITRLAAETLAPGGGVLVGDIMFANPAARAEARMQWQHVWDDDEHYAAAIEILPVLKLYGVAAKFEKVSFCAGVLEVW